MLDILGQRIFGSSVSGVGTVVGLPNMGLAFDMGLVPRAARRLRNVLITHGHIDHMAGIVQHAAIRNLQGMKPSRFIVPLHLVEPIEQIFEVWDRLQGGGLRYQLVPFLPGDRYQLPSGLVVRAFETNHLVPSQGYSIWRTKKKLKAEFQGLPEQDIRRLRVDKGIEVSELTETLEVAYTGDTTIEAIRQVEEVRKAPLLITEATFVTPHISDDFAQRRGHTHLRQIAAVADTLENQAIVLTHFSDRHSPLEIQEALGTLPESLRGRVSALAGATFRNGRVP